jgi:hypothetical protein
MPVEKLEPILVVSPAVFGALPGCRNSVSFVDCPEAPTEVIAIE